MTFGSDRDPPGSPTEADDPTLTLDEEDATAFDDAPFRPYALDGRWSGLRWFGGHGRTNGRTTSLSLTFGDDPWNPDLSEVRVKTLIPPEHRSADPVRATEIDAYFLAREQVGHLWRSTGVLRDDVRESAFPHDGPRICDATVPWERTRLSVDDDPVEFAVLSESAHWVAQAIIGGTVIGIQSHKWPLGATGLAIATDYEPYEQAERASRHRGHQ